MRINFFDEMIDIKILDANKIKIDEKSYKSIVIYNIGYVAVKNLRDTLKKYEELWNKIRDLIKSIAINLGKYDEKFKP